ncbi:YggS family pyridoxal phosphate-dependent enzyme [Allonocardiopsis opalescens]|uniref:Pyridoxal phosphate homeostasis protein n=1 Tax=Allonocardiopsis opalescens TaxID=1144618 RepID=A0A2T0Q412_9ACTN|nr:YggS family pyridoxal phosphate-dependent enzyme [Allonocardiopsis opalescens]PRX98493.1 hypothetical protein CLV72_10470 [Allonocardiopsis opalescens]
MTREQELRERLTALRERIDAAARAAGRDPAGVHLIAVTKNHPASDVRLLSRLGLADVGENRDQEAAAKARECADLPLRWHFVGQLQSNKARSVARYAHMVHSVDRPRIARALAAAAAAQDRVLDCLVQVNLEPAQEGELGPRGGADPDAVPDLAKMIAAESSLRLAGLMAVAPRGGAPDPAFARLRALAAEVTAVYPDAGVISAGMSADLESAVRNGATHLRIGTALLGARRPMVR